MAATNNHLRRWVIIAVLQWWEILAWLIAWWAPTVFIADNAGQEALDEWLTNAQLLALSLALALLWRVMLTMGHLYESRRLGLVRDELVQLAKFATFSMLSAVVAAAVFSLTFVTPNFLISFWIILLVSTGGARVLARLLLREVRRVGRNRRHCIIVGHGRRGSALAARFRANPWLGIDILGFVDESKAERACAIEDQRLAPLLGGLDELPSILSSHVVDDVFIALPLKSRYDDVERAVLRCAEQGIAAHVMTDLFDAGVRKTCIEQVGLLSTLSFENSIPADWRLVIKRLFDIIGALVLLIILSPLLVAVAVLIPFDSKGPIFFSQRRMGRGKRPFQVYKFRTMVENAEEQQAALEGANEARGPVFKIRRDPRVTRLGYWMRRYSIDELPQLVNVLLGDMSLVGPRPLPIRDTNGIVENWPRRRFSVRPGITCLWQTSGRSDLSFRRWMELDLEYIDTWSLKLDLMILLRTVPAVLRGSGAY